MSSNTWRKKNGDRLFKRACSDRMKRKDFKVKENRFSLDIRRILFVWDGETSKKRKVLHRDIVDVPILIVFKARFDELWATCSIERCLCPQQGLELDDLQGSFKHRPLSDPRIPSSSRWSLEWLLGNSFIERVAKFWIRLPRKVVESIPWKCSKTL